MIQCPSCGRRQAPRLICENCGAPLGAEVDGFAVFSLPRKLVLDTSVLERAYHELSRQIHPDRFAQGSARLRDASLGGLRDRAGRLRNIQSMGSQVDRLRQTRLRGEYLVPILAFLILAIALGLSYYASSGQKASGPLVGGTQVAVGTTDTATLPTEELEAPDLMHHILTWENQHPGN